MKHDWKRASRTVLNVSVWECAECQNTQVNPIGRLPLEGCPGRAKSFTPEVVVRVALALLLEERARETQSLYITGEWAKRYDKAKPDCDEKLALEKLAWQLRTGEKIKKKDNGVQWTRVHDLFCKVAQSFRLRGWELEHLFFLEETPSPEPSN